MIVSLPFPIGLYKAWARQGRTGFLYKTPQYVSYIKEVHLELLRQRFNLKSDTAYSVQILLHSSKWLTKKKKIAVIDAENYIKCCLDAVVKHCETVGIDFDDCMLTELSVKKIYDTEQERAVLRFTEVSFP